MTFNKPVPQHNYSCSNAYFRAVLDTAVSLGLEKASLLGTLDISADSIAEPNGRVPMDKAVQLLELAAKLSGNPDIGLYVGQHIKAGSFGLLGYLNQCSASVLEASQLMIKFKRIVFDAGDTNMHEEGDMTVYTWSAIKEEYSKQRYLVDAIFSGWVHFTALSTSMQGLVKKVELSYEAPVSSKEHQQLFGCEVEFSCPHNRIYVRSEDVKRPSPQANSEIFEALNKQACNFLDKLNSQSSTTASIRHHLYRLLPKGEANIESVALAMTVNRRTLQRKLEQEQTNFRAVLNNLRKELCEQYLKDSSLSILDVALLLGFSDNSAFTSWHRSWWDGRSPTKHREELLSDGKGSPAF
ncbi:AraC family transcriptional regulator [uncultured Pseudoteredinibacter sp.]|uniref:AraC family transcriptional regulator n=1 Tax=uncultured Pseudoteredinibacter sp. TaxID=1641701 RepID=UPI002620916C|nr:AraC family transcriptional regulator [uncultured Pseudoteredinibacter sp.]